MSVLSSAIPRRLAVNGLAIFSGEAAARVTTLGMALLVARRFGPDVLGQYGYAVAVASILLLVPDFGLHLLAVRELAGRPTRLPTVFWTMCVLKSCLAAVVLALTLAFGFWAVEDSGRRLLLYILLLRVLLQTFSQGFMAVFKAFERMHFIAAQQFTNALLVLAWAGMALFFHAGLTAVVFALVVGQAAETWLGWRFLRASFPVGTPVQFQPQVLRAMLVAAAPIGVTAVLQALNLRVDILALSLYVPNRDLGNFQAAASFPVAVYLAASLLMTVLFPKLSRLLRDTSALGNRYLKSLLKDGALLATAAALAVWLAAPQLLRLAFGTELAEAAGTLRILTATLPFVFLNTVLFYVFVAAKQPRIYTGALAAGVLAGGALALFLSARFGATGAALADLAREALVSSIYLVALARGQHAPRAGRALLKALAGGVLLLGATTVALKWLSGGFPWPPLWLLLVLTVTLIMFGRPRRQELYLLIDDSL